MPPLTTRQRRILAVVATDSPYEPRVVGGGDARLVPSTAELVWAGEAEHVRWVRARET